MGTPPASPSKALTNSQLDPNIGGLIHYDDDGAVLLGVITAAKRDKFTVLNIRGREIDLPRPRLYRLPVGSPVTGSTLSSKVESLNAISNQIDVEAAALNVEELWSFVHEECRLYSISELCQSYFGVDSTTKHAGLRLALIRERVHFKRDRDGFEPRPAEVVSNLKFAEEARRRKISARESTVQFVTQRVKDPSLVMPAELAESMVLMSEVAAGVLHSDPARQKEGKELVHLCAQSMRISENAPIEKQAFEVLLRCGYFTKDTNLAFIRHDIPNSYPEGALLEARDLFVPESVECFSEQERGFRQDLTNKHCFTIDDISTQDMDDALSIERTPDGYELGIHITDVAWAIPPDSALDRLAYRRATSIYCADQTVNMLPPILSDEKISLRQGVVRPCISVIVKFSETFEMQSSLVLPSFVRVAQRYTYDDVDLLLEHEDETLMQIYQISTSCEEARIRKGAIKVYKREVVPFLEADGAVRLLEIDEESPARALVAETMVLANSIMASFAAEHGIPVLYRGQERPDQNAQQAVVGVPEGPAKDFTARSKMKKSTLGFEPAHHAGLGLDAYIQATSPIRRYLDLCHQRQFIAYFKDNQPWISKSEFEPLAHQVEIHLNAANLASRETRRYWLLRYLEQRKKGEQIAGTVVRTDGKSPLIELDEVYITTFVKVSRPVRMGERVTLKITSVDPHSDYIRLEML